jgi:NAD(P)-dependent dehydrogenase (short-subunit alcohol dehydrogenase family)
MGELEQIKKLFNEIKEKFGRLDILVNNAAANPLYLSPKTGQGNKVHVSLPEREGGMAWHETCGGVTMQPSRQEWPWRHSRERRR